MLSEELGEYKNDYGEKSRRFNNGFYDIYSAKKKENDEYCCLKIIDKEKIKYGNYDYIKESLDREESIMKLCNSKNTINFYKKMETQKSIIFEIEEFGEDLSSFLGDIGKFSEDLENLELFKQIVRELASALKTIHEKKAIHRNIKPSSIFIYNKNEEDKRTIKLGEFGCSTLISDNKSEQVGTYYYSAPEIIQNMKYDEKCDLWSVGITLFELYFGISPYGVNISKNKIMYLLCDYYNGKGFSFLRSNKPSLDILLDGLLQIEPEKRISFEEFFNIVFDDDFMENEDKFLSKFEKYKSIYNVLSKKEVDKDIYKPKEEKESNNLEERERQNLEKIISNIEEITDIMDLKISEEYENKKINNILYYNDNIKFLINIYREADYFEKNITGAFIICSNIDSFKLIREEITIQFDKDKDITFNIITSGNNCENIIKLINENDLFKQCIKNVCVFCKDVDKWSKLLKDKDNLIYGVYNQKSDVVNFIKNTSSERRKVYPLTKLISYKNYIDNYKYRHRQIASLYGEINQELYDKYIKEIESLIKQDDQKKLKGFQIFNPNNLIELDELIIKEYTKNSIYLDLNNWLLNPIKDSYKVASYFTARLMYSLNKYAKKHNKYFNKDKTVLKRGVKIPYSYLIQYERAKNENESGKIISLTSFTSTSKKDEVALHFAGRKRGIKYKVNRDDPKFSVIYIITNNSKENWISNGIDINSISEMKREEEILFLPFTFFKVKDVIIDNKQYVAEIHLETIGKKEILEKEIKNGKDIKYNYIEGVMEI